MAITAINPTPPLLIGFVIAAILCVIRMEADDAAAAIFHHHGFSRDVFLAVSSTMCKAVFQIGARLSTSPTGFVHGTGAFASSTFGASQVVGSHAITSPSPIWLFPWFWVSSGAVE